MTCATCGRDLVPARGPAAAGRVGTVAAEVEAVPVRRCPEGHTTVADPERGRDLADRVADAVGVARAGRWRRPDRCHACGADLTLPGRRTLRTTSPRLDPLGIVTVTLDVPMLRCPVCAVESLPADAADDVPAAVAAALRGGG